MDDSFFMKILSFDPLVYIAQSNEEPKRQKSYDEKNNDDQVKEKLGHFWVFPFN